MHLALAAPSPEACCCPPGSGPQGRVCCGVHVYHLEPAPPESGGQLGLLIPKRLFAGWWAWWGPWPCGTCLGGGQQPGLLEALLMSRAPGAFWLRPWVGPEGHLQDLCPGQPGAEAWGSVLLTDALILECCDSRDIRPRLSAGSWYLTSSRGPGGVSRGSALAVGIHGGVLVCHAWWAGPEAALRHWEEADPAGTPGGSPVHP